MIYLDNAATTLKKPRDVIKAVNDCIKHYCANPGRSGHRLSLKAAEEVCNCREAVAELFNIKEPNNVVFTCNTTEALNIAIKGIVNTGDHVVISSMEHNSVLRPIVSNNIEYSIAPADQLGYVSLNSVQSVVTEKTKLIVITHASNVCGTVNPIREIGKFARQRGIIFLVDAAQTAGVIDIDVDRDNIDILATAGHKMLYGPTGTGILYIGNNLELKPFKEGGTGSLSESYFMPEVLPDRFEAGTLNILGIAGLNAGIKYVLRNSVSQIKKRENQTIEYLIDKFSEIKNIKIYGITNGNKNDEKIDRVGVLGFNILKKDSVYVCNILNNLYDIAVRGGLHCSPLAHGTLGTIKSGIARISVSNFTTKRELSKTVDAIYKISKSN